jgi:hypothetical protein
MIPGIDGFAVLIALDGVTFDLPTYASGRAATRDTIPFRLNRRLSPFPANTSAVSISRSPTKSAPRSPSSSGQEVTIR